MMAGITAQSGSKIRAFPRPPSSFDPLTAAAAELEYYGFPPRRAERCAVKLYRRVWGRIKDRYQYIEPTLSTDRSTPPLPRTPTFSPNNVNWSGGVVVAPAGQSFCGIQAEWVVPDVYPPLQTQGYWIGSWIGLDGYIGAGANIVLQAGVGQDVYYQNGSIHRDIFPWYEWYPDNMVKIGGVPVSPGDLVVVIISTAMPPGQSSTNATVYFANTTNGASMSVPVSAPSGVQLVGNSAEWIVEQPLPIPGGDTLPDYGEVFFADCEAYIAGGGSVDGGTGAALNITAGVANSVVSRGVLISPTIIQCSYSGPAP
jgi:Peptidase A4 family